MFDIDYILVPVDFSRSSRAARAVAEGLAAPGTHTEFVHVVDRWPRYMETVLFPYAPLGEDAPEIEHELVQVARDAVTSHFELPEDVEPTVVYGPVKERLVAHARSTAANLVVMGAFGEGGVQPDSVGSVTERLVRDASSTTMVVRDSTPAEISKIIVALDLGEASTRVLDVALGLALRTEAELELMYVIPDPLAHDTNQILASALAVDPQKVTSRSRDRIEAMFERTTAGIEPGYSEQTAVGELLRSRKVTMGPIAEKIVARAVETDADLIVVGARDATGRRGGLGSVPSTLLRRATCHVAVVPIRDSGRLEDD